jgi:hypothetical protein
MRECRTAIFDPRTRIKVLEELIYPSIFYSMWRTEEEKIRAMCRHKIRVGKCIEKIGDAEIKEELYNSLNEVYSNYLALSEFAPVEVRKCEVEVEKEIEDMEAKLYAYVHEPCESPEEVSMSTSTKWIKARVGMLLAQVRKRSYIRQVYAWEELTMLEKDLSSLERKLSTEPDSQVKADILEDIERVRELLLLVGE